MMWKDFIVSCIRNPYNNSTVFTQNKGSLLFSHPKNLFFSDKYSKVTIRLGNLWSFDTTTKNVLLHCKRVAVDCDGNL